MTPDPQPRPVNPIRPLPSAQADPLSPPESLLRRWFPGLFGARAGRRASGGPRPFLSEGIRQDLQVLGTIYEPFSGICWVLDRTTGAITATQADGVVHVIAAGRAG